jgi:plastocyanin
MKRLLSFAILLAACEGEPPIVLAPENPPPAQNGPSAAANAPAPAPSAETPPICTCVMPSPPAPAVAGVASAGADAAAPSGSAAASAEVIPPPAIVRGNIIGTVTTKPAAMAANAVVYLEDAPQEDAPARMQTVTIDNRQMNFIPFVQVVAVGGRVVFSNEDPFPHNVFSPDNEKFNVGNIPQNGSHQRVFSKPGAYSLLCNLHPGMLGYLLVVPTTHYARADAKGKFTMKHVPAGSYRVSAWAPRQTPVTQSVTVTDADATVNFDLHR